MTLSTSPSSTEMEVRHRVTHAVGDGVDHRTIDGAIPTARNPLRSTPSRGDGGNSADGGASGGVHHDVTPTNPLSSTASASPTDDEPSPGAGEKSREEQAAEPAPCISLWTFFAGEIKRGYALENEEDKFRQRREQVRL